jgi:hypothetical protein
MRALLVFYIDIWIIIASSEQKHLNSAANFRNASEYCDTESQHNMNAVKDMLREAVFSVSDFQYPFTGWNKNHLLLEIM